MLFGDFKKYLVERVCFCCVVFCMFLKVKIVCDFNEMVRLKVLDNVEIEYDKVIVDFIFEDDVIEYLWNVWN